MGQAPEHCIVIDDAAVGVAAGLKAGMRVIHFNRFPEREEALDGAIVIHHASELPSAVAEIKEHIHIVNEG